MQIGRVRGNVVATLKHPALAAHKLLLVEPCDPQGRPSGRVMAALDVVDAGPGDWVLLLDEGASASQILANPRGPVRTVVVGVLDDIRVESPQSHP
jgi:ethanolamine utilization protein EutN